MMLLKLVFQLEKGIGALVLLTIRGGKMLKLREGTGNINDKNGIQKVGQLR